jgi:hypothetical protein
MAEGPEAVTENPNSRRGRLNKQKGHRKQAIVRKLLEDIFEAEPLLHAHKSEESHWHHLPIRLEVKAGQQVGPIATRYLKAEEQAEAAKAADDTRPFFFVAMPDKMSDGLIICRLSTLKELLA